MFHAFQSTEKNSFDIFNDCETNVMLYHDGANDKKNQVINLVTFVNYQN